MIVRPSNVFPFFVFVSFLFFWLLFVIPYSQIQMDHLRNPSQDPFLEEDVHNCIFEERWRRADHLLEVMTESYRRVVAHNTRASVRTKELEKTNSKLRRELEQTRGILRSVGLL